MSNSPFGSYIREQRVEDGLSMREVARELGISHVYLSKVERGKEGPLAKKHWAPLSEIVPSIECSELERLANISKPVELDVSEMDREEQEAALAFRRKLEEEGLSDDDLEALGEVLDGWEGSDE